MTLSSSKTSSKKRLNGSVALISGASRGIGAAVAKRFAQEGASLILIARSIKKLEELDDDLKSLNAQTLLVPADLSKPASIDGLAAPLYHRYGKIDILVSNAAMLGQSGLLSQNDPTIFKQVLDVNLIANWYLIRALDPLLRASLNGRAIFVTSSVAEQPRPYLGAYSLSKAGLEAMVKVYAQEVTPSNLKVNLLDPGAVRTDMLANFMPGKDLSNFPSPESIMDLFVYLASPECQEHGQKMNAADFQKASLLHSSPTKERR